jgi:hypothetical protein
VSTECKPMSVEELWVLVRHYERLIQLLLEELEKTR